MEARSGDRSIYPGDLQKRNLTFGLRDRAVYLTEVAGALGQQVSGINDSITGW